MGESHNDDFKRAWGFANKKLNKRNADWVSKRQRMNEALADPNATDAEVAEAKHDVWSDGLSGIGTDRGGGGVDDGIKDLIKDFMTADQQIAERERLKEKLRQDAKSNGYKDPDAWGQPTPKNTHLNGREAEEQEKDRFKDAVEKLAEKYGFSDDVEQQKEKQDALAPEKTEVEKAKSGGPDCSDADRAAGL